LTTPSDPPTSQLLTGFSIIAAIVALVVAVQIATDAYESVRGATAAASNDHVSRLIVQWLTP